MSEEQGSSGSALRAPDGATVLRFPASKLPMADEGEAAFTQLYLRRYEAMRRYAFAELRDVDAAEDVVQGVFVGVWNRYFRDGAPPPESHWDALLYRGVVLRLMNHRRDRFRLAERLGTVLSMWTGRARRWMMPADEYEHSELVQVMDFAMAKMSKRSREVFLLARESGLTQREIAETMGIAPGTVSALMSKAQQVLRQQVIKSGFADAASSRAAGRARKGRDA